MTALTQHSDIEHIWQTAWRLGFYRGGAVFMSAISGIDIALWDLKGILSAAHTICPFFSLPLAVFCCSLVIFLDWTRGAVSPRKWGIMWL